MPTIIETNVLGYVIASDTNNQRGTVCRYGDCKALGGPGDGRYPTTTPPLYDFNGFSFAKEAVVLFDVAAGQFSNQPPYAVNIRAQ